MHAWPMRVRQSLLLRGSGCFVRRGFHLTTAGSVSDKLPSRLAAWGRRSRLLQEQNQLADFFRSEANIEALIVEVDHVVERSGLAVVEVWRTRAESAQDRYLELANVLEGPCS